MTRTLFSIVLAVVLFNSVVIAGVLFPLPHRSNEPPRADDSGSTEQGVMDVATANNEFAFDLLLLLFIRHTSKLMRKGLKRPLQLL